MPKMEQVVIGAQTAAAPTSARPMDMKDIRGEAVGVVGVVGVVVDDILGLDGWK